MCVIMYGTPKEIMALDLSKAWRSNSDGAGIILPSRYPTVIKGLMSLEKLTLALERLPKHKPIGLHLRFATHGKASKKNTHPFPLGNNSHLMHNGILQGLGSHGTNGSSDSAHLARILSKVPSKERLALLQALDGKYLVHDQGKIYLIGNFETLGNVKMSNTYWNNSCLYVSQETSTECTTGSITPREWWKDRSVRGSGGYYNPETGCWDGKTPPENTHWDD